MFNIDDIYTGWSLKRLSRHILYWLFWLLFFASMNTSYQGYSIWVWIAVELLFMIIKLPYTYFVIYFFVPRFLLTKKYFKFILFTVLFAGIGSVFMLGIDQQIIAPLLFGEEPFFKWKIKIGYKMIDLVYIAMLPTIYKLLQSQRQQEKKTQRITEEKLTAELQLLKNQLHPHFLFNTLNNLYGMVLTQDKKSPEVVLRLSEIMSYMLYECDQATIRLSREIDHLKNYIELEKIRHGKRVDLNFESSGPIEEIHIAPLLLLPFIENAFKHGVEKNEDQSWISINLWVAEKRLEFMVENNLPSYQQEEAERMQTHSGIGLENVRRRLALVYPNQHELIIEETDTFFVKLSLNLDNLEKE